jgi:NAD(P)-dependent dehydrogenase (short-subunit alcohol dehydrogenase family)
MPAASRMKQRLRPVLVELERIGYCFAMSFSGKTLAEVGSNAANPAVARPACIVTGGAGPGIGNGITEVLARHGWAVLIVDQDAAQAEALQQRLMDAGFRIGLLIEDITSPQAAERSVECALQEFGRLDGLVNSAGTGLCKPVHEIEDAEFERLFDVDFRAAFRFSRAVIPLLLQHGGSIVNIGSVHAHCTIGGFALYAAAKSALEGLTRGIAVDYGAQKVRANCVHPGLVMSPQSRRLIARFAQDVEAWLASYVDTKQLIPSLTTSRQVGELVAFLMSSAATTITGQTFTIDGGSSVMLYEREVQEDCAADRDR